VAEEHAGMALVSASLKLRGYNMTLGSTLTRTARKGVSDARDIHWQQWRQDRSIAAAVAVAAVQIRGYC
jgi:hypothetical protein